MGLMGGKEVDPIIHRVLSDLLGLKVVAGF